MCVLATKIRLRENFTSEIFYWRKYPDLRYWLVLYTVYRELIHEASDYNAREWNYLHFDGTDEDPMSIHWRAIT